MRVCTALLLAGLVATTATAAAPKWDKLDGYTFQQYTTHHKKHYATPAESAMRAGIFAKRMAVIQQHNADKTSSYKMGVNQLTDRTAAELKALNGVAPHKFDEVKAATNAPAPKTTPESVDYRNNVPAVLTAVKDQGQCGSCWAVSSVESLEAHFAIQTGNLYSLSIQELVSCVTGAQAGGGCNGFWPAGAFEYLAAAGQSLSSEWGYPYESYYGDSLANTCKKTNNNTIATTDVGVTGYVAVPTNVVEATMEALAFAGPLTVVVDAGAWPSYESGIFDGCKGNITLDHAVQLVGYGKDEDLGKDYWIVRNSWSTSYGEHGYIRLSRDSDKKEECTWNVYPGPDAPPPQRVCGQCGVLSTPTYPTLDTVPEPKINLDMFSKPDCKGPARVAEAHLKQCTGAGSSTFWIEVDNTPKVFVEATMFANTTCTADAEQFTSYYACDTVLRTSLAATTTYKITNCTAGGSSAVFHGKCDLQGDNCEAPQTVTVDSCSQLDDKNVKVSAFSASAKSVTSTLFASKDCSGDNAVAVSPCGKCSIALPEGNGVGGVWQC